MRSKSRSLRALAACMAVVGLMTVGASAATAAPATFNVPAGPAAHVKLNGTVTMNNSTTTCAFKDFAARAGNLGTSGLLLIHVENAAVAKCSNGGILTMAAQLFGEKNGAAFAINQPTSVSGFAVAPVPVPGMTWSSKPFQATWINGSGSTASKIQFQNTMVGETVYGWSVTMTGSLSVSKADGSLLTLQ